MVDASSPVDRIETRDDLGEGDEAVFAYWMGQEAIAEKEEKKWIAQADKIIKRYRDERPEASKETHRFNILWSNVETLKPTLYGRTPKPDVDRRFKDPDPVGRLASTLLERSLAYFVDPSDDESDFDDMMESVVEDRLLPARGTARVLYVPHFGDEIPAEAKQQEGDEAVASDDDEYEERDEEDAEIAGSGDDEERGKEPAAREVVFEEVSVAYVYWKDYREGPARKWREVPWVRYRAYLTRDELVRRFGSEKGKKVNLDYVPKGAPEPGKEEPPADIYKKAIVHEYWDKSKKQVIWIAPGTDDLILDRKDDPLRLPGFFPSPNPLFGTTTNDKRIPVPDYLEYQDQARELDTLTARIDRFTRALKVAGIYPGELKQTLQQLVDEGTENKLIPVGDYQQWADKGGLAQVIEWMPIKEIAETLIQLYNARDRVKAILYEVTGIGDIVRGETEPDETLGAQQLKAKFITRRVEPQQKKVAKFARNLFRLMAAVIAEHFSAKTISLITNYPQLDPIPPIPPQPQMPPQMLLAAAQAGAASPQPGGTVPGAAGPQPPGAAPDPQLQAMEQQYQQAMQQYQQAVAAAQKAQASNAEKQKQFDAAVALIKQDGVHGFRIDIEADSTIAPDEVAEQAARSDFAAKFVPFMEQIIPLAQGNPAGADMAKQFTLFVMRGFKVARPLEEATEKFFDTLAKMPPPQGDGPDSAADLAVRSKQVDATNQKTAAQVQIAREKNVVEMAKLGQESQTDAAKLAHDEEKARSQHGLEIAKLADESAFRQTRAGAIQAREASTLT